LERFLLFIVDKTQQRFSENEATAGAAADTDFSVPAFWKKVFQTSGTPAVSGFSINIHINQ